MLERDVNRAIQNIARYLVGKLQNKEQCTRDEAVEHLMKTAVYAILMDKETMLYCESGESVWYMLEEELKGNYEPLLLVD
jgi:hypothetical protein